MKVGHDIKTERANWTFDKNVAESFVDHARQSIPLYDGGHDLVCYLSDFFCLPDSVCYELGVSTGELIKKLDIQRDGYGALTLVFSPDGKTLAVGNRNYQTRLIDTETWTLKHTHSKHMTHGIEFSPDGKQLAAAYVDGSFAVWDVESGENVTTVDTGCAEIYSVSWNSTGDLELPFERAGPPVEIYRVRGGLRHRRQRRAIAAQPLPVDRDPGDSFCRRARGGYRLASKSDGG